MRKIYTAAVLAAVAGLASTASAQGTAGHEVSYSVEAISLFAITGSPSLTINAASAAGSAPTSVSDEVTSTYALTSNNVDQRIIVSIDENMPTGVTLSVLLTAPSGNGTAHSVDLSDADQDALTGLAPISASGLGVKYTLAATAAAGIVSGSRTVTYTIVDEA